MKILRLDIAFRLPDNFLGDLNDAFDEIVKYRKKEKSFAPKSQKIDDTHYSIKSKDKIFKDFLENTKNGAFLHGVVQIGDVNET